jgi:hypothetical protein
MYSNKVEKFFIEATLIDYTNNDTTDVSRYINSVNIKKNYVASSFPLFVINFMTTSILRDKMRDNEIAINLKINKYTEVNSETTEDSTEQPVIEDKIIDTLIRVYEKPFTTSSIRTEEENENEDNQGSVLQVIPYQIIGIPDELIKKNSIVVNEVYDNIKIDDVLVNLVSNVEKRNIYIEKSDNFEIQDTVLIPPLNLVPALKYVQEVYGIYTTTFNVFFDIDKTYVYRVFNNNRVFTNSFETIVIPANDISDDLKFITPLIDENNNIRLFLKNPPEFLNNTNINYDTLGQTSVFNSYDKNYDSVKRIYSNDETSNNKVRYFWNDFQNKIFEEAFINETKQISEGTSISLTNIDPSYFNIETLYTIQTPFNYINGRYSITENSVSFYTSDYVHYNSVMNIKLTKLK